MRSTLADKRVKEHHGQSLTVLDDDTLYCQCCGKNVTAHKSGTVKHLKTKLHQNNYKVWLAAKNDAAKQMGIKSSLKAAHTSKSICNDSIIAALMTGIAAEAICKYNLLISSKYKKQFKNSTNLIRSKSTFYEKIQSSKAIIIDDTKKHIDRNDAYVIILDEMSDKNMEGGIVNILYNNNCNIKSTMLNSIYLKGSVNAQEIIHLIYNAVQLYQLNTDFCNGICGDSTNYMVKAMNDCNIFRFKTVFPDAAHLLSLPIKYPVCVG